MFKRKAITSFLAMSVLLSSMAGTVSAADSITDSIKDAADALLYSNYPILSTWYVKHDPWSGKDTIGNDYFDAEVKKIIANPNSYVFGVSSITAYAPLDANDFDIQTKPYDRIYSSTKDGAKYSDLVVVGSKAYIARDTNKGKGTTTIVGYKNYSPFSINHSVSQTTAGDGTKYNMWTVTFASGSKTRIERIASEMKDAKDSGKFKYYNPGSKGNSSDGSVTISNITGDGLSYQTRYKVKVTMHESSINANILLDLENRELGKGYACGQGAGMQYSIKNDGDVENSAWRMQNGASRLGAIARPKDTFLSKRAPILLPGIWIGSIGDTGGAINTDQVSPKTVLGDKSDTRSDVQMPHFDILVDSCRIAINDVGSKSVIPYVAPKAATNTSHSTAFSAAQAIAVEKWFAPFFNATDNASKEKALKNVFRDRRYFANAAQMEDDADSSSTGGGSSDGSTADSAEELKGTKFTLSGGKSARSLTFENAQLADNQLAYSIFKVIYAIARFFVNASSVFVVVALFYIPLIWLAYVLSKLINTDLVKYTVPFRKKLAGKGFSAFSPGFAKRLTGSTILVLVFSAMIVSGVLTDIISILLQYLVELYSAAIGINDNAKIK
ncbi:hypothetical protein ABGV42_01880 [Paenibacillus pabuli]|uniref:hypothetical protein n=1 Tax=Paenibacillus pabuli TaxID=1472 RepID=UPI003242DD44